MKKIILVCLLLTGITLLTACVADDYYYSGNYDNGGNYWSHGHRHGNANRGYSSSGSIPNNYQNNNHYSSSGSVPNNYRSSNSYSYRSNGNNFSSQDEYKLNRGDNAINGGYSSSGSISS